MNPYLKELKIKDILDRGTIYDNIVTSVVVQSRLEKEIGFNSVILKTLIQNNLFDKLKVDDKLKDKYLEYDAIYDIATGVGKLMYTLNNLDNLVTYDNLIDCSTNDNESKYLLERVNKLIEDR